MTVLSDQELWLRAFHRAPSATLAPGRVLTQQERDWALEQIDAQEDADHRERMELKVYGS